MNLISLNMNLLFFPTMVLYTAEIQPPISGKKKIKGRLKIYEKKKEK